MDLGTLRRQAPEQPASSVYWRRRFIALIVGLTVLAVLAWAFALALHGSAAAASRTASKSRHGASHRSVAASAHASPPATTHPSPGASASGSAASPASSKPASSKPAGTAAARHIGLTACRAGDVVISLFSGPPSYSARQTPDFVIDVVSTARGPCSFNIGARHVRLTISTGSLQVWTSRQCAEGRASRPTTLRRGVPAVVDMVWDGEYSAPGCPVPGALAKPGTYTAVATDGSGASNKLTVRIS